MDLKKVHIEQVSVKCQPISGAVGTERKRTSKLNFLVTLDHMSVESVVQCEALSGFATAWRATVPLLYAAVVGAHVLVQRLSVECRMKRLLIIIIIDHQDDN